MRLRKIAALSLAAAMTTSLTACSSGGSDAPTATTAGAAQGETKKEEAASTSAPTAETTAPAQKVKMTVSVWDNASSPQFQAMADAFMEKHPEVEVELIDTQADGYAGRRRF